ncbi:MAG TPA: PepSY domain-containing protein [Candidatus Solibacter sp.]|nr:PepSY domain-containing protein [Candidatus Solibacter sp.]
MKTASLAHTEHTLSGMAHLRNIKHRTRGRTTNSRGTRYVWLFAVLVVCALLTACSSESSKPAETAKPEVKGPELITGRSAFQKVYVAARGWNLDAKPYRLESTATSDGNGHDGKWAVWRGSFASATQRSVKPYTWSGSAAEGAPSRGINPGTEDSYSPTNSSTQIFDIAFLKVDSDQAVAEAQKHGGDKVLEKDPNTPVTYVCDWNHNTNQLIWHVIYGASRDGAKLTVAIDASTGEFIRVEK